jgi:multidrug resistance protein, MATE family
MSINRKILDLALPNIVSNITVPLVGLVDIWLMGHLDNAVYIGAILLGSMIFLFLYAGFMFLRMGTTGFTAQARGARNLQETINILGRALLIVLLASVLLIAFQSIIGWISFKLISGSSEVESLALEYFRIRIWAAPATLGIFVLSGWFIGMQNAKTPMIIALLVNIANIIFSAFFIMYLGMKSDGVALGTVIAQYSGLILGLVLLFRYYGKLFKYWRLKSILYWEAIKQFMKVNNNILIRSILLTGTFFYFTAESASYGDDILSINSLLLQFLWILSYFIDGFAFAAEALVGKAVGAKNRSQLSSTIKSIFRWGFYISIPVTLIYVLFNQWMLTVLTDNHELILLSKDYEFWIWLMPLITFSAYIWDGIYVGATAGAAMRNTMILSSLLIFLPAYYLLKADFGNQALWFAIMLFMAARGITMTVISKKVVYRTFL